MRSRGLSLSEKDVPGHSILESTLTPSPWRNGSKSLLAPESVQEIPNIIWVGRYCQNLYNRGRAENFPIHRPGHITSRAENFPIHGPRAENWKICRPGHITTRAENWKILRPAYYMTRAAYFSILRPACAISALPYDIANSAPPPAGYWKICRPRAKHYVAQGLLIAARGP